MNLLYIVLGIFIFTFQSIGGDNEFTIHGNVEGMKDTKVELVVMNQSGGSVIAESYLVDGTFAMKGKVEYPVYSYLKFIDHDKYIYLWVEPAEIHVSSSVNNITENPRVLGATIKGSKEQAFMDQYQNFIRDNYRKVSELVEKKRASDNADEQDTLEERITEERSKARERSSEYILSFARQNNDAMVAVYMMRTEINDVYNDIWELDEVIKGFSDKLKAADYYKDIRERLDLLIQIQPGQPAPAFTLTTWDGYKVSLADFEGKVVLLDFWASWCAPCIAAIPDMKRLYSKYRDLGFEILGISTDTDKDAWLRSINQHELPWTNVIDERHDGILKSIVSTEYSVAFLPTLVLVDKEGNIAAKNVSKDELEELLIELLQS